MKGSLEMLADVFPHLVVPVGPIVAAFRAPVVEVMIYAASLEDFRHLVGRAAVFSGTAAGREVNVAGCELFANPGIMLIGHVIDRVIEIEVVVVHSVHGIAKVVDAGERVATLHMVGMFEESVGGVISAERCAVGSDRDAGRLALGFDERDDFAGDVVVVLRLHPTAMERMRAFVRERIALDAVDGEESDSSLLDVGAERSDHALAFLFMFVAHAGGESENGHAVIAVDINAHVAAETM